MIPFSNKTDVSFRPTTTSQAIPTLNRLLHTDDFCVLFAFSHEQKYKDDVIVEFTINVLLASRIIIITYREVRWKSVVASTTSF